MPYNQLLLPLIGGYILVNFTHITSYWASRQSREHFLLAAALAVWVRARSPEKQLVLQRDIRHQLHAFSGIRTPVYDILSALKDRVSVLLD